MRSPSFTLLPAAVALLACATPAPAGHQDSAVARTPADLFRKLDDNGTVQVSCAHAIHHMLAATGGVEQRLALGVLAQGDVAVAPQVPLAGLSDRGVDPLQHPALAV